MANITERAKIGSTGYDGSITYYDFDTTATTFYPGGAIGLNASGYATKFDDTAEFQFRGFFAQSLQNTVPSGLSAGDPKLRLPVELPRYVEIYISGAAITDVGKRVYASYDGTFTFTPTTYRNYIGVVDHFLSTGYVRVRVADINAPRERLVSFDPASLTTAGINETTLTVTGLKTTDRVLVQPQAALTAGLAILSWRVSAADTLKVLMINSSGGTVDQTAVNLLVVTF